MTSREQKSAEPRRVHTENDNRDAMVTWKRLLRVGLLLFVPLAAFAGWLAIQPGDRMAAPNSTCYYVSSLVYDEFDLTAMSLRGLNAVRGRQAGYPEPPFDYNDESYYEKLLTNPPLEERYFLEYPHAALLLFRAGWWIQPEAARIPISGGILDADYHNLALYRAESPDEEILWRGFVLSSRFYAAVMLICFFALIAVLEWGYDPGAGLRGGTLLLLLPATVFFVLNRYDVIPALCTALSFAFLGRKWNTASGLALGVGVLFKVYPILFAPFILRYLWSERRDAVRFATALAATGLLAFTPMLFGADLTAVLSPYLYQLTRPPEFGMTIYRFLLPEHVALGWPGSLFRIGALGITTILLLIQPITSIASILRRSAVVLIVFVTFAVFYSPQWIIWFAPLLVPLAGQSRRVGWTTAALDGVTYLTFPMWFWLAAPIGYLLLKQNGEWNTYMYWTTGGILRMARFAVCGILAWQLLRLEWPTILRRGWLTRELAPALAAILRRRPV